MIKKNDIVTGVYSSPIIEGLVTVVHKDGTCTVYVYKSLSSPFSDFYTRVSRYSLAISTQVQTEPLFDTWEINRHYDDLIKNKTVTIYFDDMQSEISNTSNNSAVSFLLMLR